MKPEKTNTYCHYPFRQIAIKDYKEGELVGFWPCCMMGNAFSNEQKIYLSKDIEKLNELTPQEMYDHQSMVQLRQNLTNGVKDPMCKICWDQEDRGLKSFREFSDEDYGYTEDGLSTIDLTVSNVCNLRCRMCSPTASNQLMKDHQYFKENNLLDEVERVIGRWKPSTALASTKSKQWDWLMANTDKIKVLKMSGGEPFYDDKVIKLLQRYIETGNAKNTTLNFHTNATLFTDDILDILKEFKLNKHVFSIDGSSKVYEYIRYPANFKDLENSILNYKSKLTNYDPILNISCVLSACNVLNVSNFVNWARKIDNKVSVNFSEIYFFDRGTAIKHLPISLLQLAKERAESVLYNSRNNVDEKIKNLIIQIDNAITNNDENKELLKAELELFDKSRNQSYRDFLNSELVEWLDSE